MAKIKNLCMQLKLQKAELFEIKPLKLFANKLQKKMHSQLCGLSAEESKLWLLPKREALIKKTRLAVWALCRRVKALAFAKARSISLNSQKNGIFF